MSVKIRFSRHGRKKAPVFHMVAADSRMPRDGRFLEKLGVYNPFTKQLTLEREAIEKWLERGAIPSTTVGKLLMKEGIALKQKVKDKIIESQTKYVKKPETEKAASTEKE